MQECTSIYVGCLDEEGLENRSLDGKEQSHSIQVTIICGFHGSHMVCFAASERFRYVYPRYIELNSHS